jgi:hypothetical protein
MSNGKELMVTGNNLVTQKYCKFTPEGLVIDKAISLPEWMDLMSILKSVVDRGQFWLGDAMRFGVGKFGEKAYQIAEATHREYGTLANYQSVATHVPPENRNKNLSFSHHQAIAKLDVKDQKKYLDLAEKKKLSVSKLREVVDEDFPSKRKSSKPKKPQGNTTDDILGRYRDGLKKLLKQKKGRPIRIIIEDIGKILKGEDVFK